MLDRVAPAITLTTPGDGAVYVLNQAVTADYTCADATAGVSVCAGPVASGSNVDTGTPGDQTFTVGATDQAGNLAEVSHTYTVADASANAVVNGDFEAGPGVGWTEFSLRRRDLITTDLPHAGSYGAHLCGTNRCLDLVQQSITIPAGGQLSYWWYMTSQDSASHPRDLMAVALYRHNGHLLALLRVHTNAGTRDTWQQATVDLAQWDGQDVTLIFLATSNASKPTHFYVDDVRVE